MYRSWKSNIWRRLEEIYNKLREEGKILKKISSKVIEEKYLSDKDRIEIMKPFETFLRTPGKLRFVSKKISKKAVVEAVKESNLFFLEKQSM